MSHDDKIENLERRHHVDAETQHASVQGEASADDRNRSVMSAIAGIVLTFSRQDRAVRGSSLCPFCLTRLPASTQRNQVPSRGMESSARIAERAVQAEYEGADGVYEWPRDTSQFVFDYLLSQDPSVICESCIRKGAPVNDGNAEEPRIIHQHPHDDDATSSDGSSTSSSGEESADSDDNSMYGEEGQQMPVVIDGRLYDNLIPLGEQFPEHHGPAQRYPLSAGQIVQPEDESSTCCDSESIFSSSSSSSASTCSTCSESSSTTAISSTSSSDAGSSRSHSSNCSDSDVYEIPRRPARRLDSLSSSASSSFVFTSSHQNELIVDAAQIEASSQLGVVPPVIQHASMRADRLPSPTDTDMGSLARPTCSTGDHNSSRVIRTVDASNIQHEEGGDSSSTRPYQPPAIILTRSVRKRLFADDQCQSAIDEPEVKRRQLSMSNSILPANRQLPNKSMAAGEPSRVIMTRLMRRNLLADDQYQAAMGEPEAKRKLLNWSIATAVEPPRVIITRSVAKRMFTYQQSQSSGEPAAKRRRSTGISRCPPTCNISECLPMPSNGTEVPDVM